MFDPTAFDNMKVVIEGAIYDLDLQGEIVITDRNDWHNLAKMSRLFNISFALPNSNIGAKMELESGLSNLAAELLPNSLPEKNLGCYVRLQFTLEQQEDLNAFQKVEAIFKKIWGEARNIRQSVEYNPLDMPSMVKNTITVDFNRLIKEEQMDDLGEMVEFMVVTLRHLQEFAGD